MSLAAMSSRQAVPAGRRRPNVSLFFTAAALAAAVFVSGCVTQQPKRSAISVFGHDGGVDARIAVNNPEKLKPGTMFRLYERARPKPGDLNLTERLAELGRDNGQTERLAQVLDSARQIAEEASADELGWLLASSLEGTLSSALGLAVAKDLNDRQASQDDHSRIQNRLREMTTRVRLGPGRTREMSVLGATVAHHLLLQAAVEGLRDHAEPIDVSGRYTLSVNEFCSVMPGNYALVQHGRVIELVTDKHGADAHIVLYGAIGATFLHLVPNDVRYAKAAISLDGNQRIDIPDLAAYILSGELRPRQPDILLSGATEPRCHLMLQGGEEIS